MEPLSSYLKYEIKVIDLLKEKIKSETGSERNIRVHYKYRLYSFDLVELDENDRILRVYEIKTKRAIVFNYTAIKDLLLQYHSVTGADVFLVYLDDNEYLRISSIAYTNERIKRLMYEQKIYKKIHEIESLSELFDILSDLCIDDKEEYSGMQFFFRGHSKFIYDPIPSIFRRNAILYENPMYHEAIRNNSSEFTEDMSTFDKLVKMQHYELPTRLLDITSNPLVALYFACKDNEYDDGALLIFPMINERVVYYDDIRVYILSNLAKRSVNFSYTRDLKEFVSDIQQDRPNFKRNDLDRGDISNVYCVLPKLNNDRIIRQYGAFFIFGMGRSKKDPAVLKVQTIKIRIKARGKKRILKELQILGIDEASLFPETDKIMKQIKSQFIN